MPGGRPTKYPGDKAAAIAVERTIPTGSTLAQIAAELDTSISTVCEWIEQHPEFSEAVTRARAKADAPGESALYGQVLAGDVRAAQMWLMNRQPKQWRDKQSIEITGKDGGPVEVDVNDAFTRLDAAIARVAGREAEGEGAQAGGAD